MKFGINTHENPTSIPIPFAVPVGIPFFIGAAPIQSANNPAPVGMPVLCRSWDEAVAKFGFSEDWRKYNLSENAHSHFVRYRRSPAVFCNLLDPETMSSAVTAEDFPVIDSQAKLPLEAMNNDSLVVRVSGSGNPLERGKDYDAFYFGQNLIVEVMEDGTAYTASQLNISYRAVNPAAVTDMRVATGLQAIDKCPTAVGLSPDLIVASGYSTNPIVAAAMATKAEGIAGLFPAKALVDISSEKDGGATTHTEAMAMKDENALVDKTQIVCWPMVKKRGRIYHMSTQLAGLMARVDGDNNGIPYESPSNKPFEADAVVLADGTEVTLTHGEANEMRNHGMVTALNWIDGLTCWGSYTACWPHNDDPKDHFIPISRMFGWLRSTLIWTHWRRLDRPMTPMFVETMMDAINIWLNDLFGGGYILGAWVVYKTEQNPAEDLRRGIARVHIFVSPPPPFQQADFFLEYDLGILELAFAA